jgi:E3 ubiquitin-protein ligase makorin
LNRPAFSDTAPCRFYLSAMGCRVGENCRFSHDPRPENEKAVEFESSNTPGTGFGSGAPAPLPSAASGGAFAAAETGAALAAGDVEEAWDVSDRECGICFCNVEGSFGLLDGCRHAFCLPCIRGWREKGLEGGAAATVRKCPVCRVPCFLVVPSPSLPRSSRDKTMAVKLYKQTCAGIACKHYQAASGLGSDTAANRSCPFGSSCLYAHFLKDGKTRATPTAPRLRVNADGATEAVGVVQLSHFLERAGF